MSNGGSPLRPPPCGGKSLIPRHLIRPNKKDFDDEEFVVFHNVFRYRESRHIGAFAECRARIRHSNSGVGVFSEDVET